MRTQQGAAAFPQRTLCVRRIVKLHEGDAGAVLGVTLQPQLPDRP